MENKLYVLFNKTTRQFATFALDADWVTDAIRNTILIREYTFSELGVSGDEINLLRYKWIGDYDTGRLVDIVSENKSVVTEKEIDEKYRAIFWNRFNAEEILMELLLNADMKTDKGKEMQRFLNSVITKKGKDINFFKNSPVHIWESYDDVAKIEENAFRS